MTPLESKFYLKDEFKDEVQPAAGSSTAAARCLEAYREGIQKRYGVDYPANARALTMLGQVVKRLGEAGALQVVRFFVDSGEAFYVKARHDLRLLLRDCEAIWIDTQRAAGGRISHEGLSEARFELLGADGQIKREIARGEVPVGLPEVMAKAVIKNYSRLVATLDVRNVAVRIGVNRQVFSVDELREAGQ